MRWHFFKLNCFYFRLFKILFFRHAHLKQVVTSQAQGGCYSLIQDAHTKLPLSFILSGKICRFFFSEVTCRDEDSIQYFEGATWSVGSCIQCSCTQGKIRCTRELLLVSFLQLGGQKPKFSDNCDQFKCNVANFMKKNDGVCKGQFVTLGNTMFLILSE